MSKFAIDEDCNNRILRGLLRRQPELDIVRLQDTPLSGADDALVLAWALHEPRVLLTHNVSTMAAYAYERMRAGASTAGLTEVPQSMPIGQAIDDLKNHPGASAPAKPPLR